MKSKGLQQLIALFDYYTRCEKIFIKLKASEISILLSVAYFSSRSDLAVYNRRLNSVQSLVTFHNCDSIVFLGVYNLPKVTWLSDPLHYLPFEYINLTSKAVFSELIQFYSFHNSVQDLPPEHS